uniref:ATP-dependent NAD(P)H-hydrate dehydratase n=1 Tax=Steinernema glaseri TaxID=37863 RepID=A0A1I7XW48_9BILA
MAGALGKPMPGLSTFFRGGGWLAGCSPWRPPKSPYVPLTCLLAWMEPADSFVRYKPGHVLYPGRALCGKLELADIGMPAPALQDANTWLNEPALWQAHLPQLGAQSHKYTRGHALVVGGERMTGASRLAARAAQRGAGSSGGGTTGSYAMWCRAGFEGGGYCHCRAGWAGLDQCLRAALAGDRGKRGCAGGSGLRLADPGHAGL